MLEVGVDLRVLGMVAIAAIGAAGTAGCGAEEVMVRSRSAQQIDVAVDNGCSVQYQTLAVAMEAYWASTGGLPASEGELVGAAMLREEIDDFDVILSDSNYEVVGLFDCARFDPEMPQPVADVQPAPTLSCDADRRNLQTAWEAYNAQTGGPPASETVLVEAGLLIAESPGFDLVGVEVVAAPGHCE